MKRIDIIFSEVISGLNSNDLDSVEIGVGTNLNLALLPGKLTEEIIMSIVNTSQWIHDECGG